MSKHNCAPPALEVTNSDLPVSTTDASTAPLLVTRKRAAHLLGVHISTLYRAEKTGQLTPVKLNTNSQKSAVLYRMADIQRIAGGQS